MVEVALIGREEELATIAEFLGSAQVALVLEGEAGIGKTTLWRRGLDEAGSRGIRVLAASASGSEAQMALTALRDLLGDPFVEVADALPPPQRRALEVALLRADPEGQRHEPGSTAVALVSALRELAAAAPLVVAVDDLQWLDAASAALLEFAARRLGDEPLKLLLTVRSEPGSATPAGLDRALGERLRRLRVGPLSVGALHRILYDRLGLTLPRPTLVQLVETSGGNPFFALELAQALQRRGGRAEPDGSLPIPASLQELVRERLAALPEETREALLLVSAASAPSAALVESALGEDAWERLRPALDAQVIDHIDGDVRFTHPFLRSAVPTEADPQQRRAAHRRLSEVVTDPEPRARHLALAAKAPDAPVAAALEEAAQGARARGAPAAAGELSEYAVRLTPSADVARVLERTLAAASYHFEAGDAARAHDLLREAVSRAPSGCLRAEALTRLGRALAFMADHRAGMGAYRAALAEPSAEAATRGAAEMGLAVALMRMLEDLAGSARHARAAVSLAEHAGDTVALSEYLATTALIDGLRGEPEAMELMRRAERLGASPPDTAFPASYFLRGLFGPGFVVGVLLAFTDQLDQALAQLETARDVALELGDDGSLPLILRHLSQLEWLAGHWPEADRLAAEGRELALQTGQPAQLAVCAGMHALVQAHAGEVEAARASASEALELAGTTGAGFGELLGHSALGFLDLSLGDPAACHARLGPLLARLRAAGVGEPGVVRFVQDEVEALAALGRVDDAVEPLAWLEERATRLDRASALAVCGRLRGLVRAARGDAAGGIAEVEAALAHHERVPIPFERARSLLVLGRLRRLAKRKRDARVALEQAAAAFERLGARLWVEQAETELGRISGRAPSRWELTPTERRIATLAAAGKTNREIAAELYVSPKTVEFHLRHVYGKLGVRSRIELLRAMAPAKD
jgi:DNA-binding CsgD family transcriptional regulator